MPSAYNSGDNVLYTGLWRTAAGVSCNVHDNGRLVWQNGLEDTLIIENELGLYKLSLIQDDGGVQYKHSATLDNGRLLWNDGDIWSRPDRAAGQELHCAPIASPDGTFRVASPVTGGYSRGINVESQDVVEVVELRSSTLVDSTSNPNLAFQAELRELREEMLGLKAHKQCFYNDLRSARSEMAELRATQAEHGKALGSLRDMIENDVLPEEVQRLRQETTQKLEEQRKEFQRQLRQCNQQIQQTQEMAESVGDGKQSTNGASSLEKQIGALSRQVTALENRVSDQEQSIVTLRREWGRASPARNQDASTERHTTAGVTGLRDTLQLLGKTIEMHAQNIQAVQENQIHIDQQVQAATREAKQAKEGSDAVAEQLRQALAEGDA